MMKRKQAQEKALLLTAVFVALLGKKECTSTATRGSATAGTPASSVSLASSASTLTKPSKREGSSVRTRPMAARRRDAPARTCECSHCSLQAKEMVSDDA